MIGFPGKHPSPFLAGLINIGVVFIIFSVNIHICSSLDAEWWPTPYCNLSATVTNTSKFMSNVKTALNSLTVDVRNTSQGRFNTCVYGQSPNKIYGLLQCRGDASVDECYNCSQQAKNDALQYCGNYVGSRVWSRFCFLRYNGNYDFIGHLDTNGTNRYNAYNASPDPNSYLQAAGQLLSGLSSNITSGSATNRYASGSIIDSGQFYQIYGLAQCWGDISLHDCNTCLSTKIDELFKYNPGRLGARGLAGSCILQYEEKAFFNHSEKSPSRIPIISGVLGGLLLLFIIIIVLCARRRLKQAIFGRRRRDEQPISEDQVLVTIPSLSNVFTVFKMETLVAATENFHNNNKLGEGGFGAVYKGISPEGSEIAVKKLSLKSKQGKKEFLNEVKLVAKVQHRNLVKLLGCCAEGSERLLVYEYLPNNSLDQILFGELTFVLNIDAGNVSRDNLVSGIVDADRNKRRQLDWQKRFSIILGVTRGLLYLHEDSSSRIIHRDIKAGNILLDRKLNPKIADFGLARLFPEEETHVRTIVAGTRGYMAPEYAMHGQLSVKADVYSFGILLLELLSGRKNTDYDLSPEMQILLEWAWELYKRGKIVDMIDPAITETCSDEEQALRCIHVGLLCTQANSSLRPSMSTVNLMLSTKFMLLPDPTKPAFVNPLPIHDTATSTSSYHGSSNTSGAMSSYTSGTMSSSASSHTPLAPLSNANASITELEAR